jgi:phosphoglycolate phosphatase-like HAD superfamily hydrolase
MPLVTVGSLSREIDVAVFDKDGTLIDFHRLWWGKLETGIAALVAATGGGPALEEMLYHTMGAEPARKLIKPDGPYAAASIAKTGTIAATVLHQWGMAWHEAEELVARRFETIMAEPAGPDDIRPIGDLVGLFRRMKVAGISVAISTNDNREASEASLRLLGIEGLVDAMVCGDDALPSKPAPDQLLHIAQKLGASPARLLMAGDTVGDLLSGRAAGAGLVVGVLSGAGERRVLEPHADVLAADVHAIGVG